MEEPEAIGWSTFIRRPSTSNTEEEIRFRRTGGGEPGRSGAQGRKAKLCQPAPLTLHTSMSSSSPKIGNKPSKQDAPAWRQAAHTLGFGGCVAAAVATTCSLELEILEPAWRRPKHLGGLKTIAAGHPLLRSTHPHGHHLEPEILACSRRQPSRLKPGGPRPEEETTKVMDVMNIGV
jgi:hypothetical protein